MTVVTRKFHFDAAHMLPKHSGKCSRLHGHTYQVEVSIGSKVPLESAESSDGMVLDFGTLKDIVNAAFLNDWDHRFLAKGDEWPASVVRGDLVEYDPDQIWVVGVRTTVENLTQLAVRLIMDDVSTRFPNRSHPVEIRVSIAEGLNNSATSTGILEHA